MIYPSDPSVFKSCFFEPLAGRAAVGLRGGWGPFLWVSGPYLWGNGVVDLTWGFYGVGGVKVFMGWNACLCYYVAFSSKLALESFFVNIIGACSTSYLIIRESPLDSMLWSSLKSYLISLFEC